DLAIALGDLFRAAVTQRLKILDVSLDGLGQVGECERQQVRVGQSQNGNSGGLRQSLAVDERRIAEMHEPVEIIVYRMIDPTVVLALVAKVEGWNAEVVEERRVVGSRAERADAEIVAIASIPAGLRRSGENPRSLDSLPRADSRLRIRNISGNAVDEFLEGMRPLDIEVASGVGVAVQISDGVGFQLVSVRLDPLG